MRDQIEQWLRIIAIVLVALVLWQIIHASFEANPLAKATIPAIPTLTTNAPATNAPPMVSPNGMAAVPKGTNPVVTTGTNLPTGTNVAVMPSPTNLMAMGSNVIAPGHMTTLVTANTNLTTPGTNGGAPSPSLVSTQTTLAAGGTNLPAIGTNAMGTNSATGTNSIVKKHGKHGMGPGGPMGMMGMMGGMGGMGTPPSPLPPAMQARVDKIVNSEILAPVFHPLPMALMGIAGNTAFLRTASGQSGLVKEGDSLGEVKLLRIGINRVLVEQGGQKTELTIFDGYGGESLLSTTNGSSK